MAILAAFNSEEVEVVGISTIFGNVKTNTATDNAFILLNLAGRTEVGAGCCLRWGGALRSQVTAASRYTSVGGSMTCFAGTCGRGRLHIAEGPDKGAHS